MYQVGELYEISHTRKGRFTARVLEADPASEWTTVGVVSGIANAMNPDNIAYPGDTVTIRNTQFTARATTAA